MGAAAGILAFSLLVGIAGGVVWGFVRPAYVAAFGEGGGVQVDQAASPKNVEFAAFGWFALISLIAGLGIAWLARQATSRGGSAWVWWVAACAFACAATVYVFGDWIVSTRIHIPDHDAVRAGEPFRVVPPIQPGVGWLVGPFTAAFAYWIATMGDYLTPDSAIAQQSAQPQSG